MYMTNKLRDVNKMKWYFLHSRGTFCRPKPITPRVIVFAETKPSRYAKQNECGVYFFRMHRVKVQIHETEFFLTICETQVCYMDANAAVLFNFVPIKQTRSLAVKSEKVNFLESPFRHQFFSCFPHLSHALARSQTV
jgi:hypothetical protein